MSEAKFNKPWGVFIDQQGRIWIADSGNDAIRIITPDYQNVSTVAGLGIPGYVDGKVSTAKLDNPWQFFMTSSGINLIADGNNNMIRGLTFSLSEPIQQVESHLRRIVNNAQYRMPV